MRAGDRSRRPVVLLRPVPVDSVVHDLWAGTKLLVVAGAATLLAIYPGWFTLTGVTALLFVGARLARIPRSAVPSMPAWVWIVFALGAVIAAVGGGPPFAELAGQRLGLGGLLGYLQFTTSSAALLGLGALMTWTTNVSEIAPALARLGRPLAAVHVPVTDWAATLSLALRAFPMLIQEFRTLFAARRLRPKPSSVQRRWKYGGWWSELIDQVAAATMVALRRAGDMGAAIAARGGSGQISAQPGGPRGTDAAALALVSTMLIAAVLAEVLLP